MTKIASRGVLPLWHVYSLFSHKDGSDQVMGPLLLYFSLHCAYKYCLWRLPCLPLIWHFLSIATHTHTRMHARTHARTHTHTHTHKKTKTDWPSLSPLWCISQMLWRLCSFSQLRRLPLWQKVNEWVDLVTWVVGTLSTYPPVVKQADGSACGSHTDSPVSCSWSMPGEVKGQAEYTTRSWKIELNSMLCRKRRHGWNITTQTHTRAASHTDEAVSWCCCTFLCNMLAKYRVSFCRACQSSGTVFSLRHTHMRERVCTHSHTQAHTHLHWTAKTTLHSMCVGQLWQSLPDWTVESFMVINQHTKHSLQVRLTIRQEMQRGSHEVTFYPQPFLQREREREREREKIMFPHFILGKDFFWQQDSQRRRGSKQKRKK